MAFPRILRRWRLRNLMIVVALCATALAAYREYSDRGLFYQILRLRAGPASARVDAALGLGLMGPRAWLAIDPLTAALDDPDPGVRFQATYALVRHGSRSSRLLPILVAGIEHTPEPESGPYGELLLTALFDDPPKGWPLSDGGLDENDPVEALKKMRPPAALVVPMLGKALKDPDRWVRRAARDALFAVATWSNPSSPKLADALLAVLADYRYDPLHHPVEVYDQFESRKRAVKAFALLDRTAQEKAVALLAGDLRDLGSPRSYEASLLLPRLTGGTDAAVAILEDQVRDHDEIKRAIALILLASFGERAAPAVPTLIQVITDRDADRNVHLGFRMGWWGSLSAREANDPARPRLLNPLPAGETSAIALCVRALRAMGEPVERRSIRELIAVIQDPDQDDGRRRGAIVALGEFGPGTAEAIPALIGVIRAQEQALRGPSMAKGGMDSPGVLATRALGKIGADGDPKVVAILAGLIEARDRWIPSAAALELERLGTKAKPAIPALVKGLKSPNQSVRFEVSDALGKIGGPEVRAVLPALVAALDDEDRWVRTHAAQAVAPFGAAAKEAVPKIVDLLWEFGPGFEVARSLGRIGPDAAAAMPPLLFYLSVVDESDRDEIGKAIDCIMPRTPGATIAGSIAALKAKASDPAGRFRAAYELGRLIEGPPHPADGVAALGEALGDPDPLVRRLAAAMLCRLGSGAAPAGPALIRAAGDPDESVRKLVTVALGRAAAELPGANPALAGMMRDRSGTVRRWAAGSLAWVGNRAAATAAPAMIAGLEGQDVTTRASILTALGKLARSHESVIPALLKALDDPSDWIRIAAVDALGEHVGWHRDVVVPALLKALDDPSQGVRFRAGWSLGKSRPAAPVLPLLIERLKKGSPALRATAAGALSHLRDVTDTEPDVTRRAVAALAAALADKDPGVRQTAAASLQWFGGAARAAVPALRAAMDDPNRSVRDKASAALQWIAVSQARR